MYRTLVLHRFFSNFYYMPLFNYECNQDKICLKSLNHHCSQFFRMRQNRYQKTDWVDVKWQGATIEHSIQKDGCNCGVFVMKVRSSDQLFEYENICLFWLVCCIHDCYGVVLSAEHRQGQ